MVQDQRLSKNFTLYEYVRSDTAEKYPEIKEKQYSPTPDIIENIKYHIKSGIQPLRDDFGFPLFVESGRRCIELNRLPEIGSKDTSAHVPGLATDVRTAFDFEKDPRTLNFRNSLRERIESITENPVRPDIKGNGYLFAFSCLRILVYRFDQVIHEYGTKGNPAWVHFASPVQGCVSRCEIKILPENKVLSLKESLLLLC